MSLFITIEGLEGVGKTTCINFLRRWLQNHHIECCFTREPGGTEIAELIRRVVLDKHEESMTPDTELLLVFAARAQHIAKVIKPELAKGNWVVSDRFTDCTYAYQGAGRGMQIDRIATLEQWVQGDLRPDVTILLDAPLALAMQRAKARSEADRIESEDMAFFERIRNAYLAQAKADPERYISIDASQSLEGVQGQLRDAFSVIARREATKQSTS